ncbi:MAG: hypothetical protein EOP37_01490 [Rubrivivax sp.]|nr:MAG: hypothetical protein EOP37_01490 [Rubrivivax sp.]
MSAINIAFLLTVKDRRAEALDALRHLDASECTYFHGVGVLNKLDLPSDDCLSWQADEDWPASDSMEKVDR